MTGTGGGGIGDSSVRSVLCSSLRDDNCCFSGLELEDVIMAFEVGSIVMGRSVNVSVSSILGESAPAELGCTTLFAAIRRKSLFEILLI